MADYLIVGAVCFVLGAAFGNYWAHRKLKGLTDAVTAIKGKLGA